MKYPILESGFVSNTEKGLLKPVFVKNAFVDFAIDKDHLKSKNMFFYNKDTVALYDAWMSEPKLLKNFDFREKIITTALRCFNSLSIYNWIQLQSDAETVGELHSTFMKETIAYIYGTPRTIETVQWIRLLEANIKTTSVEVNVDRFFNKEKYPTIASGSNLTNDLIRDWVSLVNGYEDLLITLQVIFGDRPWVTDVANKNV